MNLDSTPEDEAFRARVRAWLAENVPRGRRPAGGPEMREFDLAWQRKQYEAGFAGISWPAEHGGRGLPLDQQMIWYEEYANADAPPLRSCFVGLSHAGPTLIARANEAQKAKHLPAILRGEAVWCQGFSEPGAGSDLASLRTRAVVDGDHLVVTGQKIWTSFADIADYQELLVRTDPAAPKKHQGITWVICDMKSPGITIRPIPTISGPAHFCEVFYDEVRIPLANVVGRINEGWSVAMSTLAFERGTAFMADQVIVARRIERLIELAKRTTGPDRSRPAIEDDELARRLATARAECAAVRAMTLTGVSRARRQATPGPEGSMVRLYFALLEQRVARLAMDLLGTDSLVHEEDPDSWTHRYLYDFAQTIGGGTSEIQRNIIGERVLGLPKGV